MCVLCMTLKLFSLFACFTFGVGETHEMDGYISIPRLSLFGNRIIDLTLSIGFFGFSWSPEVVSVGGNSRYVGGKSSDVGACHLKVRYG